MRRFLPTAALLALLAAPAAADDVHLANGRVYEDVLVEDVPGGVRIRLPFGSLTLPAAQVARVVRAPAALSEYLARKSALEVDPESTAEGWLALARWARAHDLAHGAREAALLAAELEPHLAGLAGLLVPAGYRIDEELGRWLPLEEAMARQGFVRFDGTWVTREDRDARLAAQRRQHDEVVARRAADYLARLEHAAAAVAAESRRREQERLRDAMWALPWSVPVIAVPVLVPSFYVLPPAAPPAAPAPPARAAPDRGYRSLIGRQPGSFIPVDRTPVTGAVSSASSRPR